MINPDLVVLMSRVYHKLGYYKTLYKFHNSHDCKILECNRSEVLVIECSYKLLKEITKGIDFKTN